MSPPFRTASACAAFLAASACAPAGEAARLGIARGVNIVAVGEADREPAPSFAGPGLRPAGVITSAALAGKVGVVNFWGSWCGPCRKEQRGLEALWVEYRARGVQFLGVNVRDQRAAALAYLDEFGVTYPSIFDPDSTVAFRFKVRYMPDTYLIDRRGRLVATIIGAVANEVDLRKLIEAELA